MCPGSSIAFYIRPMKKSDSACPSDMTTDICREFVTFVVGNHGNVVTFVVGCDIYRGNVVIFVVGFEICRGKVVTFVVNIHVASNVYS